MSLEEKPKLTPYWQRVTDTGAILIEQRMNRLKSKTVPPEYCISNDDKFRMSKAQMEIEGMQDMIKTVRKGGFWGKLIAADAVLTEKPSILFSKPEP